MQALLDALQQELTYQVPDVSQFVRVTLRLVMAAVIAGVIGWEREGGGKAAGLRTHMLVSLGSALFVLSALEGGVWYPQTRRGLFRASQPALVSLAAV